MLILQCKIIKSLHIDQRHDPQFFKGGRLQKTAYTSKAPFPSSKLDGVSNS